MPAFAQDRGADVFDTEALAKAHAEQRICTRRQDISSTYKCECVAAEIYTRLTSNSTDPLTTITEEAYQKCPNIDTLLSHHYARCSEWASYKRADYEQFCNCYARNFVQQFARAPRFSSPYRVALMTEAYKGCSIDAPNVKARERQALRDNLQRRGLLERLFVPRSD